MNTPLEFGDRLSDLRFQHNVGQKELGRKLRVVHQTIINWEYGHSYPTFWNLVEIAKLFNVDLNWLMGHEVHTQEIAA